MTIGPEPMEMEKSPFLTKDKEYIILAIFSDERGIKYYIQDDENQLGGFFDSRQFLIKSNYIPDNWVANIDNKFGCLELLPKKWDEAQGFLERLHDGDPEALELFISERDEIYRQENYFGD